MAGLTAAILAGGAIGAPVVFAADKTNGLLQRHDLGILTADAPAASSTGSPVRSSPADDAASPVGPSSTSPVRTSSTGTRSCTATYRNDGYQGGIIVRAGSVPITGWEVSWPLANGQQVTMGRNAKISTRGDTAVARNDSDNGALAAGNSTTFEISGGPGGDSVLTCTAF